MAEHRYQAFKKLMKVKEEEISENGNKKITGNIGSYQVNLELLHLRPSGTEILLRVSGFPREGHQTSITYLELYEGSNLIHKDWDVKGDDPVFQGVKNFTAKNMFYWFILPTIIITSVIYGLERNAGNDAFKSLLNALYQTSYFYIPVSAGAAIGWYRERKLIKLYNELMKT